LELVTAGDRWSAGGGPAPDKGLFVKELEEALLDGRADLAVHSAKDLPGDLPAGLGILAVPPRADPRDVVVGPPGGLAGLPAGARVATGSPRRAAQVVGIRGNVDTRLRKLADGGAEALVLAAAGLERLGLAPEGAEPLAVADCTPAPGQGLLALEGRLDRPELAAALAPLDDPLAHVCLRAERALLAALGGGCMTPVGALCEAGGDGRLAMVAFAGAADGSRGERVRAEGPADDPEALGARAADKLREAGAIT